MSTTRNDKAAGTVLGHGGGDGRLEESDHERPVREGRLLVSAQEVAVMLGVCRRTVHRLVASGELARPVKVGSARRFAVAEVMDYIERLMAARRANGTRGREE